MNNFARILILICAQILVAPPALSHHVLGRPSYSLNEDSNTPPSMQVETQIGKFYVTYMVFPAFPRANEPGRVNLYASRIENGEPFTGQVHFSVRDDSWFSRNEETLGSQAIDDGVFRQGFQFSKDGHYILTAQFEADGEPYTIDFPLQVGESSSSIPITIAVVAVLLLLGSINFINRKKLLRHKIQTQHQGTDT